MPKDKALIIQLALNGNITLGKSKIGSVFRRTSCVVLMAMLSACTSLGPYSLQHARLDYNEVVKSTTEEQLLLNIVRLRYSDTPSSLSVSAIAAQFERTKSLGLVPFANIGINNHNVAAILPQAEISVADRPTFSMTPLDDQEFTRKLFTPVPLDGVIYLAKTTWPISTVFRLYLENLNWVSNGQTASGPTPKIAPTFSDFNRGMEALQTLQDQGKIVFSVDERIEPVGGSASINRLTASNIIEAAKNGYEYHTDEKNAGWHLTIKVEHPVLLIDPSALDSPEMQTIRQVFKLEAGLNQYDITQEVLSPFPTTYPAEGVNKLDLETRSLLQALYFVSQGVDVPAEHLKMGLARQTLESTGKNFDWNEMTKGLFRVQHAEGKDRPANAHVAIQYKGVWFYIDESDLETKSTFSLLMEISRLELSGKAGPGPILTLPIGAH